MAEAGWYACDEDQDDLAQCFFCDKQLDGWEPEDDPWEEHRKHSPKCPFLALGKKEALITYKEHLNLCFEVEKKRVTAEAEQQKGKLVAEKEKLEKFMKKRYPRERKGRNGAKDRVFSYKEEIVIN